jgi:hypothetical protein
MSAAGGFIGLGLLAEALEFLFEMAGVDWVASLFSPIGLGPRRAGDKS